MTPEQRDQIQEILKDTWGRYHSADEALELIEDIIDDIVNTAKRSVE